MSVESELQKKMQNLEERLEKMEAIYPQLYCLMVNLKMISNTNCERADEVIRLMDSIKTRLQAIEKYVSNIN